MTMTNKNYFSVIFCTLLLACGKVNYATPKDGQAAYKKELQERFKANQERIIALEEKQIEDLEKKVEGQRSYIEKLRNKYDLSEYTFQALCWVWKKTCQAFNLILATLIVGTTYKMGPAKII